MKIDFIVDENYLIVHTLSNHGSKRFSSEKFKKDVVNFQNMVWGKSEGLYGLLVGSPSPGALSNKAIKNIPKFIEDIKSTEEYNKLYKQTLTYRNWVEKRWQANFKKTLAIMEDITGLQFDESFTVYITHPSMRNGRSWGNNIISWGCKEAWPNYSVVYIWHEILHTYFDRSEKSHALIELITDNELRAQLSGVTYPPFEGHADLAILKKKLLPQWKKYLKSAPRDIKNFK